MIFSLVACKGGAPASDNSEMAKIPSDYPINDAPVYAMIEFVSYTDNSAGDQYSSELVFNSSADYQTLLTYYKKLFPDAILTDFGIAYNILNVPKHGEQYMVGVNIYSSLKSGVKGACTVTMTVIDY